MLVRRRGGPPLPVCERATVTPQASGNIFEVAMQKIHRRHFRCHMLEVRHESRFGDEPTVVMARHDGWVFHMPLSDWQKLSNLDDSTVEVRRTLSEVFELKYPLGVYGELTVLRHKKRPKNSRPPFSRTQ